MRDLANSPRLGYLLVLLCGIASTAAFGGSLIWEYLHAGLPVGWDTAGHFVISQLYYDNLWPRIDGTLDAFFQGMQFPTFYPPLFYLLCGALYAIFPSVERVLIFKLLVIAGVVFIPSLLGLCARQLGIRASLAALTALTTAAILCSGVYLSVGLESALLLGFATQGLSVTLLLVLILLALSRPAGIAHLVALAIVSALFLLSNYHVVIVGSVLVGVLLLLLWRIDQTPITGPAFGIGLGTLLALPWYIAAFAGRASSPAVPESAEILARTFNVYSFYGLILPATLVVALAPAAQRTLACFAAAVLASVPLIVIDPTWVGLTVAWQPSRMMAVLLLLIPLLLFGIAEILMRHRGISALGSRGVALFAALITIVPLAVSVPAERTPATFSATESESVVRLTAYLKANPTAGYFIGVFSADSQRIQDQRTPLDMALSQYAALSGARGLWAVFRESSFNSIFATALRNFSSTRYESWGIPSRLNPESYEQIPIAERLATLPRWGIDRIITRTEHLHQLAGAETVFAIEYQDEFLTVGRLKTAPVLQSDITTAVVLVGPAIAMGTRSSTPDFAALSEYLATSLATLPTILQFQSCDNLLAKLQDKQLNAVACLRADKCCTRMISSFEELTDPSLLTPVRATVHNKAALDWNGIVAAPFRKVELQLP
jgi:hypothetical protein